MTDLAKITQPTQEDISRILFFAALNKDTRIDIARKSILEIYNRGESIIGKDDETKDVFFLLEGTVEILTKSPDGQMILFKRMYSGEYFGDFSAIDGEARSAEVEAYTKCKLLRMSREVFLSLLFSHPKLAIRLMERLVAIIRGVNVKIVDMATKTVIERIYNYLIENGEPYAENQVWVREVAPQAHLAAEFGTSRETVSRALNKLISDQIIVKNGNDLYVRSGIEFNKSKRESRA